jgi:hypothetical protein
LAVAGVDCDGLHAMIAVAAAAAHKLTKFAMVSLIGAEDAREI